MGTETRGGPLPVREADEHTDFTWYERPARICRWGRRLVIIENPGEPTQSIYVDNEFDDRPYAAAEYANWPSTEVVPASYDEVRIKGGGPLILVISFEADPSDGAWLITGHEYLGRSFSDRLAKWRVKPGDLTWQVRPVIP